MWLQKTILYISLQNHSLEILLNILGREWELFPILVKLQKLYQVQEAFEQRTEVKASVETSGLDVLEICTTNPSYTFCYCIWNRKGEHFWPKRFDGSLQSRKKMSSRFPSIGNCRIFDRGIYKRNIYILKVSISNSLHTHPIIIVVKGEDYAQ